MTVSAWRFRVLCMDKVECDSSELKPKFKTIKAGSTRCMERIYAKFETICGTKRAEIYTRDLLGVRMVGPNYNYQVKMAGLVYEIETTFDETRFLQTEPIHLMFDDDTIYRKFRFHRHIIFELTDEVTDAIEFPDCGLGHSHLFCRWHCYN